jgi:hypothetical protein
MAFVNKPEERFTIELDSSIVTEELKKKKLARVFVPGGGVCLFNAVGMQLTKGIQQSSVQGFAIGERPIKGSDLRRVVCGWLTRWGEMATSHDHVSYADFYNSSTHEIGGQLGNVGKTYADYVRNMELADTWGDERVLQAMSDLLFVRVEILQLDGIVRAVESLDRYWKVYEPSPKLLRVALETYKMNITIKPIYLCIKEEHYYALLPYGSPLIEAARLPGFFQDGANFEHMPDKNWQSFNIFFWGGGGVWCVFVGGGCVFFKKNLSHPRVIFFL